MVNIETETVSENREKTSARLYVYLLLFRGEEGSEEVFLIERANPSFQDGMLTPPAGRLEPGETPSEAARREGFEEAGVDIQPENLRFEQVLMRPAYNRTGPGYDHTKTSWLDFTFSTRVWDGEPFNAETDRAASAGWHRVDQLPENMLPGVRSFLKNYPNHEPYAATGFGNDN